MTTPIPLTAGYLAEFAERISGEIALDRLLEDIVDVARSVIGARYVALGVLDARRTAIETFIHVGMDADTVRRIGELPTGGGLLGRLITDPRPIRLAEITDHPSSAGFPAGHPPMGSFLGAPIRVGGTVFGNLYLCDKPGGFTDTDEASVTVLAAQAGLAVSAAQVAESRRLLAVQDERDRISRDLHDGVLQALFSVGMGLEGARALLADDPSAAEARIDDAVALLDDTAAQIRTTIFGLRPGRQIIGLDEQLAALVAEYTSATSVAIETSGDEVARVVPGHLVPDLVHVAREALSNAIRHGRATMIQIDTSVSDRLLHLRVTDDGCGFAHDELRAGHGLANMAERAAVLSGGLDIDSTVGVGTIVRLRVPIDEPAPRPREESA